MRRGWVAAMPLTWLTRLGAIVALVLVTLVALVAYSTTTSLVSDFNAVRHTRQVSTDLMALLSVLDDAETGQRGYIITGNAVYLQPYTGARATIDQQLAALGTLTADEPGQQQQLALLRPLVVAKLAELDETVALRRTQGFAAAAAIVATDQGRALMDQIRGVIQTMQAAENSRESAQTAATEAVARRATVARAIGGFITVSLAVLANFAVIRELRRRQGTETSLRRQYREADEARRETAAILNATNEAILLLGPDRRAIVANPRFGELFGLDVGTIHGRRFDAFEEQVAGLFADPAAFRALVAREMAPGSPQFSGTIAQYLPEPRDLHLFSAAVSTTEGGLLGRLFVFRDVTKERAAERLKTEFVALVSHELRTPLTSIKGYVDLLAAGEAGPVNGDQLEFLGVVKVNADRLVTLINDLLDISRIEAGKVELHREALALGPLLQQVAASLRPLLNARRQTLTLVVAPDLPTITGDVDRLTQVFTNLLSNATKYTPDGGSVRIAATGDDGNVRVDVSDTGIGMTTDELGKLFTRFFRATNRMVREAGGTGLGLTICRSLVELHGGEMSVHSSPGNGSTFSVRLPAESNVPAPMLR